MRRRRASFAARTAPTAIVFTRMPFGVHAAAIAPVRLFTAALAAPYGAACGMATRLAPEEMLTIEPLPFSSITAAAARDRNHTLPRFTARTWCHSSSVHFRIDLVSAPPALFTRMSTVPSSATVWSISCLALVRARHIRRHRQGATAERSHFTRRCLEWFPTPGGQDDVSAVLGENQRRSSTDSGATAGDDCDTSFE